MGLILPLFLSTCHISSLLCWVTCLYVVTWSWNVYMKFTEKNVTKLKSRSRKRLKRNFPQKMVFWKMFALVLKIHTLSLVKILLFRSCYCRILFFRATRLWKLLIFFFCFISSSFWTEKATYLDEQKKRTNFLECHPLQTRILYFNILFFS